MKFPFILAVPQADALLLHCPAAWTPVLCLPLPLHECQAIWLLPRDHCASSRGRAVHNSRGALPLKVLPGLCRYHSSFQGSQGECCFLIHTEALSGPMEGRKQWICVTWVFLCFSKIPSCRYKRNFLQDIFFLVIRSAKAKMDFAFCWPGLGETGGTMNAWSVGGGKSVRVSVVTGCKYTYKKYISFDLAIPL